VDTVRFISLLLWVVKLERGKSVELLSPVFSCSIVWAISFLRQAKRDRALSVSSCGSRFLVMFVSFHTDLQRLGWNDEEFGVHVFQVYLNVIGVEEELIPYKFLFAKQKRNGDVFA